jgi:Tol biopolymer transport system component
MEDIQSRLAGALADRYRIEREVGAGGMATVYLAHDLKHDRDVALKVLHPELGAVIGAERFLQEIKTTARLQHPHILGLIDSGEAGGLLFYVMPFVSGESLRNRLTREKQLPIPVALRIANEVASALDYAHRHGVVHRDIKPENVLLHDGQAMVADFGIALAVTMAGGGRITQTGMSLGTPHYMSPEQALGEKEITPRSDVYALGAMTYVMLTGDPPFTGSTAQAILAKVMNEKPVPPSRTRETLAPHVEAAILTALAKLPADRWGSAKEFSDALVNPALTAATTAATAVRAPAPELRRWRLTAAALGVLLLLTAAGWALLGKGGGSAAGPPPLERFSLVFDGGVRPVDGAGSPIAFAPDGTRLAFLGRDSLGVQSLYVRALDQQAPVLVPGTRGALVPFFSPDGLSLGFWLEGRLRKVAVSGGPASTICEIGYPTGASWGSDGFIVLGDQGRLVRVSASGGTPEPIAVPDSGSRADYRWPDVTSDGKTVVFTMVDSLGGTELGGMSLPGQRVVRLGVKGMNPHHISAGYLVWTQEDGILQAAPFDARRLRLTGAPQPVAEGIRTGPARVGKLGMARSGAFAYLAGDAISRELVFLGPDGKAQVLPLRKDLYQAPRVSPDGSRIALEIRHAGVSFRGDVWIYDLRAGSLLRLTSDSLSHSPAWAPDSKSVLFILDGIRKSTLLRRAADGSGKTDTLVEIAGDVAEAQLGRDGRTVALVENTLSGPDISLGLLDSLAARRPVLATRSNERSAALSPSSQWLAYVSDETGRDEVYIRGTREGSGKWAVSSRGGAVPRWAPGGRELYFMSSDSLFASRIAEGPEPRVEPARSVMPLPFFANTLDYDVMPDGRLLWSRYTTGTSQSISITLHLFEQFSARPAAPR